MIKHKIVNKIERQLFVNYIKIFVIEAILVILLLYISSILVNKHINTTLYNPDNILFQTTSGHLENIRQSTLPKHVYIEQLSNDYVVLDSVNSPHAIGYRYSKEELLSFDRSTHIIFYEDDMMDGDIYKSGMYLIKSPWEDKLLEINRYYNTITVLILLLCLIITFVVLSKTTAKDFLIPIKKLLVGFEAFQKHHYHHRISFNSSNELDALKDAFNQMSETVYQEMVLREKAEKNKEQLILDITHDIKTPLTSITGYCEVLKNDALDMNTRKKFLNIIIENSNRINHLMRSLHEVSYADQENLDLEDMDLSEMLRELFIDFIPMLENNHMTYVFNIPEEALNCQIDGVKLRRAIGNIIHNSIKYSGPHTSLTVDLTQQNTALIITIKDNGKGMQKRLLNTVFEPFVRGDLARDAHAEGSGIGLTIAKKYIDMHHGSIAIHSGINQGCHVIITLPMTLTNT